MFNTRIQSDARPIPQASLPRVVLLEAGDLSCIDNGPPCVALLIDRDGDRQEEAVVPVYGQPNVYARLPEGWVWVGRLMPGQYQNPDELRQALAAEHRWRIAAPTRYHGLEIGTARYAFVPDACDSGEAGCQ